MKIVAICLMGVLSQSCVTLSNTHEKPFTDSCKDHSFEVIAGLFITKKGADINHPVYLALKEAGVNCVLGDHQARMTQLICSKCDLHRAKTIISKLPEDDRKLILLLDQISL